MRNDQTNKINETNDYKIKNKYLSLLISLCNQMKKLRNGETKNLEKELKKEKDVSIILKKVLN